MYNTIPQSSFATTPYGLPSFVLSIASKKTVLIAASRYASVAKIEAITYAVWSIF